jgi:hypothetical protein
MRLLAPKDVLFVDTAMSDINWKFDEPHDGGFTDDNQPHMVRLAWLLEDKEGEVLRFASHLVNLPPETRITPDHAMRSAIFDHQVQARGHPMIYVLEEFFEALKEAGKIVAHNWRLNQLLLERSMRSVGLNHDRWNHETFCMMKKGGPIVGIQGAGGPGTFKEPSFSEITQCVMNSLPMVATDPMEEGMRRIDRLRAFYHRYQSTKKAG